MFRTPCDQHVYKYRLFLKLQYDNLTYFKTYLCQTMSPKYRYKFRCFCNALFSCSRLILLIQTNVLKLYREIRPEYLATSALCSPSNEECHLVLPPDKKFSCLRRIRRQRNQLYPFLQILEASMFHHTALQRALTPCTNANFTCTHTYDDMQTGVGGGRYLHFNRHVIHADDWIHSK